MQGKPLTTRNRKPSTAKRPMGFVLYQGPSMLDADTDIVALYNGCPETTSGASTNDKTGVVGQISIFETHRKPGETKRDPNPWSSTCGDCPLRHAVCYVTPMGTSATWKAWRAGKYAEPTPTQARAIAAAPKRWGADGDPAAIPLHVIERYFNKRDTGFTHQWKHVSLVGDLSGYFMASVETEPRRQAAKALGYRTYRVAPLGDVTHEGEIECPHYERGVQCKDCRLCSGARKGRDVVSLVHGAKGLKNYNAVLATL